MLWIDSAGHVVFGTSTTAPGCVRTNELTTSGTFTTTAPGISPWSAVSAHDRDVAIGRWGHGGDRHVLFNVTQSLQRATGTSAGTTRPQGWHRSRRPTRTSVAASPTPPIIPSARSAAAQITALYNQTTQTGLRQPRQQHGRGHPISGPSVTPAPACTREPIARRHAGRLRVRRRHDRRQSVRAPRARPRRASVGVRRADHRRRPWPRSPSKTTLVHSRSDSPSQGLSVTVTLARDTTNTVAGSNPYATGLHLTTALALAATAGSFSATLNWPAENIIL